MRVLITGGTGFIGKKLAARLLAGGRLMGQPIDGITLFDVGSGEGVPHDPRLELRTGDITREEGIALVRKFDHEFPERFAEEIFQYLSIPEKEFPEAHKMFEQPVMDREYFLNLADSFRSPHLWTKDNSGEWKLRHNVWDSNELPSEYLKV